MAKINLLPQHLAELIAAGEVVERPASVVKELLENAIDAGATSVTVEIKRGGISYLRVTDNGEGIHKDDIPSAFLSHATSKLRSETDLSAIGTLGFRGEALASIAAVARVSLLTRTPQEEIGHAYQVEGGQPGEVGEAGCPQGTTLVVRDLFYNVPARMKFLKKDVTEGNAVASVVERLALSHPEVSFRFLRDEKQQLLTPGDNKLYSAIYAVLGKNFAQGLIPVDYRHINMTLTGYVCKPQNARPNRNLQFFFINGRLVKSATCSAALGESYRHSVMTGKFPSGVLHLTLPADEVDVNVHPAKIEVRFEREKDIFDLVYYGCKSALSTQDTTPVFQFTKEKDSFSLPLPSVTVRTLDSVPPPRQQTSIPAGTVRQEPKPLVLRDNAPVYNGLPSTPPPLRQWEPEERHEPSSLPLQPEESAQREEAPQQQSVLEEEFRLLGEAFETYLIVSRGEELVFIDKHAAHERMLFDRMKEGTDPSAGQLLLQPLTVSLTREEQTVLLENQELLESVGFDVEDFGDATLLVRQVPAVLQQEKTEDLLIELADLLQRHAKGVYPEKLDDIYHTMACRAAVKAGDFTSEYEQRNFVRRLFSLPDVRCCPHGRPVLFVMKRMDLEKQFKRRP